MSNARTQTYPSYRDDEPAMQRLAKCIAFELSAGGNAAAAAMAVMRDVRLGHINLPSPAWRDRIREAVEAERVAAAEQQDEYTVWHLQCVRRGQDNVSPEEVNRAERDYDKASAALDALLSGEG